MLYFLKGGYVKWLPLDNSSGGKWVGCDKNGKDLEKNKYIPKSRGKTS